MTGRPTAEITAHLRRGRHTVASMLEPEPTPLDIEAANRLDEQDDKLQAVRAALDWVTAQIPTLDVGVPWKALQDIREAIQ